uniref:Uncharacterized protein n=1 Tax=Fagus sylvatica TaxID=28930 RepID=A0A2N9F489_FAGSY
MANSEAVDSEGAMATVYTNQSKLRDLRVELHYSPAPHITGAGSPHYPAVTVDTTAKPSTVAPDVTRKHENKIKRRTKGAHFQYERSRSPGFMITGERAGFLHYPSVMVNAFRKASAAAPAETKSDGEDETRAERAENAAMAAEAHATQGQ